MPAISSSVFMLSPRRFDDVVLFALSESFHPGWKAYIDGHEAPIHLANYNFMACFIAPGEHRVRFEFKPASFNFSLNMSFWGLGIFAGILLAGGAFGYRKKIMTP